MSLKPRWYVVHVHSGSEKKVAEQIIEQAEKKGLKDQILDTLIPTEEMVEIKKGAKVNTERNFFPGYILIQMVLTNDSWHLVKDTQKVTGFLGTKGKPSPVSEAELGRILSQVQESHAKPMHSLSIEIGEQVRVVEGPFSTFTGVVEEVDADRQRLKVAVSIFGRPTPVDLDYTQIEKI